ncbi:M48 family metalloprotease [Phormidium sp. CLA17]|uniref:M48 family metallopeptidase n=1 Tax=Leptolyngbya sp. Cla-17 TaxID=2803751 RepID=UPI001492CE78|nr:M48 family metallopeptidase [Leptolyngbya sp. Cla-17]MBM0741690.1 M48 family metalloprotease [Leptolyngbya sp. Cla-17]
MFRYYSQFSRQLRRWGYICLSIAIALVLTLGQPMVAQAISWGDLILRGIQVVQLSSLSDRQEVEIGQQINQQLTRSQVRILQNPQVNQYVNQIGQRLAASSTRPNIPYRFQVVDDRGVNAFATMGGFVYINRGLLNLASNEAELASVMAHEIGHIAGRHSVAQMRKTAVANGLVGAAGLNRNTAVNIGVELAFRRPNSRQDEYSADALGLETLAKTGYAQSAMVNFMSKLLQSRSTPTFLSTHPATSERIDRLQQSINPANTYGDGLDGVTYRSRLRSLS